MQGFTPQALAAIKQLPLAGQHPAAREPDQEGGGAGGEAAARPRGSGARPEQLEPILPLEQAKEEFQKRYINEVLERNGGNRTQTAKDLGVDPRTIFRHLERMEAEKRGETLPPDESLEEQ